MYNYRRRPCRAWSAQSNKGKDPTHGERTADSVCSVHSSRGHVRKLLLFRPAVGEEEIMIPWTHYEFSEGVEFVHDVDNHLPNGHLLYEKGYDLDKDLKGGNIYSLENCTVVTSDENEWESRRKQQKKVNSTKRK